MPYRAGAGSGLFGSYTARPQQPMVDVGGSIDALVNGASSLIRQAYEIKRAKQADQLRQQEFGLAQQREQREQQREQREAENSDREFGLKELAERHRFIENGGIPANSRVEAVPAGRAAITPLQPNPTPIASAMGAAPPVRVTPSAGDVGAPIGGSVPVNATEVRTTPESYDPTRAGTYQRTIDAAVIRENAAAAKEQAKQEFSAEQQRLRLEAQQKGREYVAAQGKALVAYKAKVAAGSNITRGMTSGQLETMREHLARGVIDRAPNGSYDEALEILNSPEGESARKAGVTPAHLAYAHSQFVKEGTQQAVRFQTGLLGIGADSAAAKVDSTRKLIGGGGSRPATAGAQPATSPAAPTDKKPPAPSTKAKTDTSSSGDDFTDEEVLSAYTAGKKSDKDIRDYIIAQRGKKRSITPPRK